MKRLYLAYFSATDHTEKVVKAIERGMCAGDEGVVFDEVVTIDLTVQENRKRSYELTGEDVAVLAAPVYGGRIPELKEPLFQNLRGDHTPAVTAVTYGNRAYDDALLEIGEVARGRGFIPVAAGAFLGEHTYSSLLASGRPDERDLETAEKLGREAMQIIRQDWWRQGCALAVPGNRNYRKGMGFIPFVPVADDTCIGCGLCAKLCPVGAIKPDSLKKTSVQRCIRCFACVKKCPRHSRSLKNSIFWNKIRGIEEACKDKVCEPELCFGHPAGGTERNGEDG